MKKTIVAVVALLFLVGFTSFTFAKDNEHKSTKATQENIKIIRGKVISVDQTNTQTDRHTDRNTDRHTD